MQRANWWLRGVVSASNFANVNNNGNANNNGAGNALGVRPDFTSAISASKDRRAHMRKEKESLPEG